MTLIIAIVLIMWAAAEYLHSDRAGLLDRIIVCIALWSVLGHGLLSAWSLAGKVGEW